MAKRFVPEPPAPSTAPVDVTLPIRTVTEDNTCGHWYGKAKRAKTQRRDIAMALAVHLRRAGLVKPARIANVAACPTRHHVQPTSDLLVKITRTAPSAGLDASNLVSSQKHTQDAVADALGIDDRDPRVAWVFAQRRGAFRQYAVRIEVFRREENAHAAISIDRGSGGITPMVLE